MMVLHLEIKQNHKDKLLFKVALNIYVFDLPHARRVHFYETTCQAVLKCFLTLHK